MPLILGANSLAGGYQVKNSLRFNSGSSDYLNRTMTTATNNKIYTWSGWIKKTTIGESAPNIFGAHSGGYRDCIRFDGGGNALQMIFNEAITANLVTTQLLRDVSAWYHIVVAVDTTQATSTNRVKIYLNGSQITSFSTSSYPPQNYTNIINGANVHVFGKNADLSNEYFNGYMSEIYFIDGQALTPSSFGETDEDTGIWKPKAYTGSFGTNGFYLDFEDSANLGNDMSGNNNDFTVNNLTSIDQSTDTPTNNFCTLNPLFSPSGYFTSGQVGIVTTQGNLYAPKTTQGVSVGTIATNKMPFYFELKVENNNTFFGVMSINPVGGVSQVYYETTSFGYYPYSNILGKAGTFSESGSFDSTQNVIYMFAVNPTTNKMWYGRNGTWVGDPSAGTSNTFTLTSGYEYTPLVNPQATTQENNTFFNFGNPPFTIASGNADANGYGNFEYAVPSGYYALCTKNLADFG